MKLLEHLNWRYATKKFDPSAKVGPRELNNLKEAIRLSVSSYGLQLYKVLIIEDAGLKKKLRAASWDQAQITDASHLIVFCNYTRREESHVDAYINTISRVQGIPIENIRGYGESIKQNLSAKTDHEWYSWSRQQTYLALANLLMACAELKIDACPMEGFEAEKYNEILDLESRGLNAAVIAPIGYRSPEDQTQYRKKVRKSAEALFQLI